MSDDLPAQDAPSSPSSPSPSPSPPPSAPPPEPTSTSRPRQGLLSLSEAPRPLTSVVQPETPDLGRRVVFGGMGLLVLLGLGLIVGSSGAGQRGASAASAAAPASASAAPLASVAALAVDAGPDRAEGPLAEGDAAALVVSAPQVQRPPPVWRASALSGDPAVEVVEGTFGKVGFSAALTKAGLAKAEVKRLVQAFEGIKRVEHALAPKDAFVLARDKAKGTLVAFELVSSPVDVWQVRDEDKPEAGQKPAKLVAKKLVLFVEERPIATTLAITTDLAKAVTSAGLHEDVVHLVDDALEGREDTAQVRPGARVRLVGREELVEGSFARTRLDAVELVPRSGSAVRVYWYERDPEAPGKRRAPAPGFYDAKAQQPFHGVFRSPVPQARITSRFNPKRLHPVLKVVMPHNGIDYGASTGTPVYASGQGTVISAGNSGPCGNMVEIEHPGGLHTAYCHLSRFAAGLHSGQHVEARQLVGYVGQTGRVTGPHLHFAVKRGTMFLDPLSLKMDGVRVLPPVDREVFAKYRPDLDAKLDAIALPSSPDVKEPDAKDDEDSSDEAE